MYSKCWQIIKDDAKKTFEVCAQTINQDPFNNRVYAMQKAGMKISGITPPVTNKSSNRSAIKITGYSIEDGLFNRLTKEFNEINLRSIDSW